MKKIIITTTERKEVLTQEHLKVRIRRVEVIKDPMRKFSRELTRNLLGVYSRKLKGNFTEVLQKSLGGRAENSQETYAKLSERPIRVPGV